MDEAKLIKSVVLLQTDVATIKETLATQVATKSDIEDIKILLDKVVLGIKDIREDHTAAIAWLQRHDKNFEAHDKIIGHDCNFELAVG